MPHDESPTLLRRQLGRFLREMRERQGLTIHDAAKEVQLSYNALQRLESGRTVNPRRQDVRELCMLYEVDADETKQAVDLAARAAAAKNDDGVTALGGMFSDAFNMYVGMERSARRLLSYQVQVPGLLQTADYARALIGAFLHDGTDDEIERRVQVRRRRQVIVTRKARPVTLEILLDESALHRIVGGPRVMRTQLAQLAEIGKRDNVGLRIHPHSAGFPRGILHGSFVILDFGADSKGQAVEPPVVYLDGGMSSDLYLEKQELVRRYTEMTDEIRRTALDENSTRDCSDRWRRRSTVTGDLSHAHWFKSSRSASNGQCVEVAFLDGGEVGVRDSTNPAGPALVFAPSEWDAFVAGTPSNDS